ncbi:MAG: DUF5329 family protein, partial [Planctomycetota bacterium]
MFLLKRENYLIAAALIFSAAACARSQPAGAPVADKQDVRTETAIIEQLIASVTKLEGAKFVRNGSEYSVANAIALMRGKWNNQKDEIVNAEQFIQKCATRSETSGKDYEIILKSGER